MYFRNTFLKLRGSILRNADVQENPWMAFFLELHMHTSAAWSICLEVHPWSRDVLKICNYRIIFLELKTTISVHENWQILHSYCFWYLSWYCTSIPPTFIRAIYNLRRKIKSCYDQHFACYFSAIGSEWRLVGSSRPYVFLLQLFRSHIMQIICTQKTAHLASS